MCGGSDKSDRYRNASRAQINFNVKSVACLRPARPGTHRNHSWHTRCFNTHTNRRRNSSTSEGDCHA